MPNWKMASAGIALCAAAAGATPATVPTDSPVQTLARSPIDPPADRMFRGAIGLDVDARDVAHRVFVIHEGVPVQCAGAMTLLYPRWEAASHGPSLTVTELAGLEVSVNGRPLAWHRDEVEPHAFHLNIPAGVRTIDVRFEIVADADRLSADVVAVSWQHLLLYPAGWYARNIMVAPSVTLPTGLKAFTSLETVCAEGDSLHFTPVSLEQLLDAPVLAGVHAEQVPLGQNGPGAVSFDLVAPWVGDLAIPSERVDDLRRMVTQARAMFGAPPFDRYEVLARMSDDGSSGGTEHRASAEINMASAYFSDWAGQLNNRDIVVHEFVHAWNGLYRVPADLWAPTPNVPQGSSLLWVYEGQTEFWGRVLAARAGLRSREETLDKLALDAAEVANRPGRAWRPLSDDVNYPSFMLRQPVPWRDWQRRKDYYLEGVLLWLDVEAMLRAQTGGRRGIDDFAHDFFAGAASGMPARTYTVGDVSAALNRVAPFDWGGFLHRWVDGHAEVNTSEGLDRLGWRVTYTAQPTLTFQQNELELGGSDLSYSVGLMVADDGRVRAVAWDGPAFRVGMAPGVRIKAIGGAPFTRGALDDAVRNTLTTVLVLTWEQDGRLVTRTIDYRAGLRYPRLERIPERPDGLATLLKPR
ncbi:M61 family metallopeptidase [Glacieibacterium megasporae]|uniref:M61 family metallopeptidase n=1 Tax=Glacieibacterium megasporae TaxID=2835787 RepID=UPI001C1DD988|nr:peptidase M61 [Polymorphobacter megasporae]UAJ08918.1 peptidase M61 [Polymorphobacter megasporae]